MTKMIIDFQVSDRIHLYIDDVYDTIDVILENQIWWYTMDMLMNVVHHSVKLSVNEELREIRPK